MKKLLLLRKFLEANVPYLKNNPDKLLMFVEIGEVHDTALAPSLSYEDRYTAVIVITDFDVDPDTVKLPIIAWLKTHQPDRSDSLAFQFAAEILDSKTIDLEIKIKMTERVLVTRVDDTTVTTNYSGEPIYAPGIGPEEDPLREWVLQNG